MKLDKLEDFKLPCSWTLPLYSYIITVVVRFTSIFSQLDLTLAAAAPRTAGQFEAVDLISEFAILLSYFQMFTLQKFNEVIILPFLVHSYNSANICENVQNPQHFVTSTSATEASMALAADGRAPRVDIAEVSTAGAGELSGYRGNLGFIVPFKHL